MMHRMTDNNGIAIGLEVISSIMGISNDMDGDLQPSIHELMLIHQYFTTNYGVLCQRKFMELGRLARSPREFSEHTFSRAF